MFFGPPKEGAVLRMPDFCLDMSIGYTHINPKSKPHMTSANSSLVFEDTQKRNPTAAMEFLWVLNYKAVKYRGFAPPPLKNFTSKAWGEKKRWKCALQPVCTYLTTSTGARWCITDSAKIFHCLILSYINHIFLLTYFLDFLGSICDGWWPSHFWNDYLGFYPPTPLKGRDFIIQ